MKVLEDVLLVLLGVGIGAALMVVWMGPFGRGCIKFFGGW